MDVKNIKVNNLPVLTWHRDALNDADLPVSQETVDAIKNASHPAYLVKPEYPEGLKVTEGVSQDDASKLPWIKDIKAEKENYVAGKYPIYTKQDFLTGMGREADELIKETAVPVRLIEAPAGKKFEKPVYLHYTYPNGSEDVDITFIHMEKGSNLTLIQYLDSDSINGSGFAGTQTKVVLEDDAVLHLIKVQCLPLDFVYFNDMGSFMKERAHFQYTELVLGGKNNYLGCAVDQTGRESDFKADLGFIVSNGNLLDLNYNDIFRGSKSKGVMRFNGVMIEGSKKASRETLDFRKGCIDADGDEEENILMLGPNIENRTIPLILGEEEKVNGRHAATAGKLSEDMLFYMETRGIDERQAREMMIRSNISKVTRLIPNEEIAMAADARIDRIFAACDGDCRNCPTAH